MASSSLLDFITTLVHDPAAAAAYRADPQSALSAANLHDVTTADIDHLIPVVAETSTGSVWSSSNAVHSFDTASFDSNPFGDTGVSTDHVVAVDNSSFNALDVPDFDTDPGPSWTTDETTQTLADDTSTGTPTQQNYTGVSTTVDDSTWTDTGSLDAIDVEHHDSSAITDHTGFDHF